VGNPKVIFSTFSTVLFILQVIYVISEENKLLPSYTPHLKNVTALPCKMQSFSSDLRYVGGSEKNWL